MGTPYLTSDAITLRPMTPDDAANAMEWFPGRFPVSLEQATVWLREQHRSSPWNDTARARLVAVEWDASSGREGEIVAGIDVVSPRARRSWLRISPAAALEPARADEVQAAILDLVVPWGRDELELMVLAVQIGADQPRSIAACQRHEMHLAARLREHLQRPGRRVDLLTWEALNPNWRTPDLDLSSRDHTGGKEGERA